MKKSYTAPTLVKRETLSFVTAQEIISVKLLLIPPGGGGALII